MDLEFQRVADIQRICLISTCWNKSYPLKTLIVDGGRPKRGYEHSYDSNAGVGFMDNVLKKFCTWAAELTLVRHQERQKDCDFFIFHQHCLEDTYNFFCERISRDTTTDTIWKLMKAKLVKFYMMDMAPEVVDPIFSQFHKFRLPEYRRIELDEAELRKQKKLSTSWSSTLGN